MTRKKLFALGKTQKDAVHDLAQHAIGETGLHVLIGDCSFDAQLSCSQGDGTGSVTANSQTIECFKGSENNEFDVIWPGGTLKIMDSKGKPISKIARIPGTPNLKVGQTALLYLWRKDPTDYFTILSWENGVNPIKWDERAKDFRLEFASPSGLPKRTRASRSKLASTQAPTLSEFKQKVRATLSRPQIRR